MEIADILSRLEGILAPEELLDVEAELRGARSRGERHWLEDLLDAAEALPLPEVPPIVSRELRALFGGPRSLESHAAELVRDSRMDRALAGVRGGDTGEGWSVTFTSEVADLVIDVWPRSSGETYIVEGHMMPHAELVEAVRATAAGPTTSVVGGDELGRFRFENLPRARYRLAVDDGRIELTAQLDLEGEQ